ncbi:MAG: aminotransferase class V-fold PLP-dependent enzyme, partial [Blastocatellia bacterium]|nr:aminotransferase class V-fold PLP-dependent enzyme [Blastocatellia bacterium]
LSGHKIHAPKGVGALFLRKDVRLTAQQLGGHHERDRRAGTENVPGIVALGRAAELARQHLAAQEEVARLRDRLEQELQARFSGVTINGTAAARLPNLSNLSFAGVDAESLLIALDLQGIAVSTGAACSSGSTEPSHVLTAMNFPKQRIRSSLRISLSRFTTETDIERVLAVFPKLIERQRAQTR